MARPTGKSWLLSWHRGCRVRKIVIAAAALPLFQAAGCFPNLGNAVNFEFQAFVNALLLNATNIFIQNILGL